MQVNDWVRTADGAYGQIVEIRPDPLPVKVGEDRFGRAETIQRDDVVVEIPDYDRDRATPGRYVYARQDVTVLGGKPSALGEERHDYEPGDDHHPMHTDPLCAVCGRPRKESVHP
jgi:hypothetical protein